MAPQAFGQLHELLEHRVQRRQVAVGVLSLESPPLVCQGRLQPLASPPSTQMVPSPAGLAEDHEEQNPRHGQQADGQDPGQHRPGFLAPSQNGDNGRDHGRLVNSDQQPDPPGSHSILPRPARLVRVRVNRRPGRQSGHTPQSDQDGEPGVLCRPLLRRLRINSTSPGVRPRSRAISTGENPTSVSS